ncbi:metallo-beta-lactamase domain protein [Gleimia coleocanis DSM 15436]|uniref:Metallo-beta-lactamase domain protein n=1 Tax=Gleimia coleocanis DSM 15436 TaxID=525245 RepID=C0W1P4_9ACTO|nr:MBL fold metallo-hydrolase [Gleimia coleocanis]EEH63410.1 metallo-beta-lactamase domain protein [Gleimia coleocanis DSM 15436]
MRIHVINAEVFGENAYVIAPDNSTQALIVDPGVGTAKQIETYLAQHELIAGAVLLTHGHFDHVWEAATFNVSVWIPQPDIYRLENPLEQIPMNLPIGSNWVKPADIKAFPSGVTELIPGLPMVMVPAPGHTEGSALFLFEIPAGVAHDTNVETPWWDLRKDNAQPMALSGDVVFMQSVGRTDLPGGDETQMRHSLRTLANAVDPKTIFLPGHGYATQWGFEQENNAYVIRAKRLG